MIQFLPDTQNLVLDDTSGQCIESTERLIKEQYLRVHRESPRDRIPLPHSSGKLPRFFRSSGSQIDPLNRDLDPFRPAHFRFMREDLIHGELDVPIHVQPRQKRIVLKDKTTVASRTGHPFPVDENLSFVRQDQSSQEIHQG